MKHLAATDVVHEVGPDTYAPTSLSNSLTEQKYRDGIVYTYDVAGPSFRHLPSYLKSTNYVQPTSLMDGPFQAAHKTDLPFFAWLDANPPYMQIFNSYMSAYRAGRISWLDPGFYPVQERLADQFNSDHSDVLLVDVGGGLGHDLQDLREKYPALPGKLVLQDRAEVIAEVSTTTTGQHFQAMAHDFFTPQLVKGARAYYLHSVLHDWSDDDSVKILEALKPALKEGYSTVLINELVVPSQKANWPVTSMDHLMMVLGGMRERTEAEWRAVLKRAGFKVLKIHSVEMGSESLIEAELA